MAKALEEGYATGKSGFHGYYFKILKGQGSKAPGGAINYVIEGIMIGGFAMVAVPAEYRVTGIKTFIVSYEGTVYQRISGRIPSRSSSKWSCTTRIRLGRRRMTSGLQTIRNRHRPSKCGSSVPKGL